MAGPMGWCWPAEGKSCWASHVGIADVAYLVLSWSAGGWLKRGFPGHDSWRLFTGEKIDRAIWLQVTAPMAAI